MIQLPDDLLVWAARFLLFTVLGFGWKVVRDTPVVRTIYAIGWMTYLLYTIIYSSDLPLYRAIVPVATSLSIGALIFEVLKSQGRYYGLSEAHASLKRITAANAVAHLQLLTSLREKVSSIQHSYNRDAKKSRKTGVSRKEGSKPEAGQPPLDG